MKYKRLMDEIKIDKILDIVLSDDTNKKYYRISRIDCFNVNFYFQLDDIETLYFKIFNPSNYGNELLKKQKEIEYYETAI